MNSGNAVATSAEVELIDDLIRRLENIEDAELRLVDQVPTTSQEWQRGRASGVSLSMALLTARRADLVEGWGIYRPAFPRGKGQPSRVA